MPQQEYKKRVGLGIGGNNNSSSDEEENLADQVPDIEDVMDTIAAALKSAGNITSALTENAAQERRRAQARKRAAAERAARGHCSC